MDETAERALKTGWHLSLALLAAIESRTARSNLRRLFLGACFGWHLAAALIDWEQPPERPDATFG